MYCRIYCVNLPSSIDRELDLIDRSSCRLFFCRIFHLAQACLTCRILCFVLCIKGKTLAMFYCCCLCCVCEYLVRSRGVCLHIYLGLSRIKIMSRAWWSVRLLHKELKDTQVGVLMLAMNPSEVVRGLGAVIWSW